MKPDWDQSVWKIYKEKISVILNHFVDSGKMIHQPTLVVT